MKRISAKATVYLIDGSNFSRSFWDRGTGGSSDALEAEFLNWLDDVSRLETLRASCFRVIFDGGFRPARSRANPAITVYFSEHESADDFLLERASFMTAERARCVIVSNDRGIRDKASAEGANTISCEIFYRLAAAELKKSGKQL
jgi:predicted RNA-binding protein with PIN domain